MKDLEIHERSQDLKDVDGNLLERMYIFGVQTVAGPFEKPMTVKPETLADADGLERARSYAKAQFLADLRRLRDQLNSWNLG